ncbi:hypothetical protein CDL15_Pgr027803 [Punica granatum]|uniref:Uncharacterized protein n=1 Tax=Punica granatum TaxID=22663 RepID=A0A218XJW4_PUNGR|nr:hypothetical protein CDL15_Pgr027803 [Punica granatum]
MEADGGHERLSTQLGSAQPPARDSATLLQTGPSRVGLGRMILLNSPAHDWFGYASSVASVSGVKGGKKPVHVAPSE